jgi:hypothetical protein
MNTVVKLKNIFSNEIVYCLDINNVKESDGIKFIRVYKEENPKRTFLVNKDAFKVVQM